MSTRTGVRALVMVTLCYGALEIVGLLLLLTFNYNSRDFLLLRLYSYLLTDEFLVAKHVQQFYGKFLLGLECYYYTQLKAYDITKLTAELKIDNVQYRNKIHYCCFVLADRSLPEAMHIA